MNSTNCNLWLISFWTDAVFVQGSRPDDAIVTDDLESREPTGIITVIVGFDIHRRPPHNPILTRLRLHHTGEAGPSATAARSRTVADEQMSRQLKPVRAYSSVTSALSCI